MSDEHLRTTRKRPMVGAHIRKLRTERGLTLAQVSGRCGLNVGYLSQVETDKASPSLETLASLAEVLDVPIHWLLVDAAPPPKVVRRDHRAVEPGRNGSSLEIVDGGFARTVRIVEGMMPPGTRTCLMTDAGEEHHLVLEGHVMLRQGTFEATLGPGDYLVWDGAFPHEAATVGDEPARLLVITPGPGGVAIE